MTGAISFQAKSKQTSVAGAAGKAGGVKGQGEQPQATGEKVTIGGPGDPCLIGKNSPNVVAVEAEQKAAAKARVAEYFKNDEANDKKVFDELGLPTKRDADGFLTVDEEAVAGEVMSGMLTGDGSFFTKLGEAVEKQAAATAQLTPPAELKDYHARVVEVNTTAAKAYKEIGPALSIIGKMMGSIGDIFSGKEPQISPEDEKALEAIAAKIDAAGGPDKFLGASMESIQKETEALKAERKQICAQYGITPGQWE
jgi:hypothetical protein